MNELLYGGGSDLMPVEAMIGRRHTIRPSLPPRRLDALKQSVSWHRPATHAYSLLPIYPYVTS